MSERAVEQSLIKEVKDKGGIAYKFVSPSHRNVPDRLCLYPIAPEHRKIVSMYVQFVECKDEGKQLKPGQFRECTKLADMGYFVTTRDHR
jgi:hypothetical protein